MKRNVEETIGAIVGALLISACSVLDMNKAPPSDWPALTQSIERLPYAQVQEKCRAGVILQVWSCPIIDFEAMTCTIYTATDAAYVLDHERGHCSGRDHVGSNQLADEWRAWKGTNNLRVER